MLLQEITYPAHTWALTWRLEEDAQQLVALCRDAGILVDDLQQVPVKRLREKAVERMLLQQAFGLPVTVKYTPQGAPFIVDKEDISISFTHTPLLVAMAWSDKHIIGIDAEQCDRRQVIRVRDKFLNAREKSFILADDLTAHLIAWTAKEAVIKAVRNNAIDWTNGIVLDKFTPNPVETRFDAYFDGCCYHLSTRMVDGHFVTVARLDTGQTDASGQ